MKPRDRPSRRTMQRSTVGSRSAQRASLFFAAKHLALAPRVEADDQFQVGPPRGHSACLFSTLLRLVDQCVVDLDAPLVALRRLEVFLTGASDRRIPEAL